MDEKTTEDKVRELRDRVTQLEITLFRVAVAVGAAAMVLGYVVPLLTPTDGDVESTGILPAIFSVGDPGNGPLSEETAMVAVVFGVFAAAVVVALIALLRLFASGVDSRAVRFARGCGIVALVGCVFGWLLVIVVASKSDGELSAFSPAMLSFTIGGAATLAAAALHPADWRR